MTRSVLAILAGIVVLTVTSFAIEWVTNPVLAGVLPDAQLNGATWLDDVRKLIMLVYTTLCVACGGYVTAWLERFHGSARSDHGRDPDGVDRIGNDRVSPKSPSMVLDRGVAVTVPAAWCGAIFRVTWGIQTPTNSHKLVGRSNRPAPTRPDAGPIREDAPAATQGSRWVMRRAWCSVPTVGNFFMIRSVAWGAYQFWPPGKSGIHSERCSFKDCVLDSFGQQ